MTTSYVKSQMLLKVLSSSIRFVGFHYVCTDVAKTGARLSNTSSSERKCESAYFLKKSLRSLYVEYKMSYRVFLLL